MEPSTPSAAGPDAQASFARRFCERARARANANAPENTDAAANASLATKGNARLSFADFMELALYDPECGYYAAQRERVGRGGTTDFYTASSMDEVFGPLVAAAAARLLGGADNARSHAFVEIGAEPGRSVFARGNAPEVFAETRALRLGDALAIPERVVVFSNELCDAQPFHRVAWRDGAWREAGVEFIRATAADAPANASAGSFAWCELAQPSAEVADVSGRLPREASEGYTLDLPLRAVRLLERIAAQPWRGLFLAFDYGRTWSELCTSYPAGTGRAYAAHRQNEDLLANPGQQDLTCHVCWDWLADALHAAGFTNIRRESQEAFFMHHAAAEMEHIVRADRNPLSRARSQLKHLLHPGIMGQKFEVLWALR